MAKLPLFSLLLLLLIPMLVTSYDGPLYDSTAYTECKMQPEAPLYGGGMLKDNQYQVNSTYFPLTNLDRGTKYCFSIWIKTNSSEEALIKAFLEIENYNYTCIGTVVAKKGCWSFLKGGFVLQSPKNSSYLRFKKSDGKHIGIEIASASLQPFTDEEWRFNQDLKINETRKRAVRIHVADRGGVVLPGAKVKVELTRKYFPFGAAIADSIIGNSRYQKWFVKRFNAAVFENELKWYATERVEGHVNYTVPDKMLEFTRSNQIMVRGHNVVWTRFGPEWTSNLTGAQLQSAVDSRIESLLKKYKGQFVNWDVNNEVLHSAFYEERLGPNATLEIYKKVQRADPLAGLFLNEYNVVEHCDDDCSTVDTYIARIRELERGGILKNGIGLQGHFGPPNPPLMRGILDKFATLGIPIWMTEVDMSRKFPPATQALQLEEVLRESYSHPAVDGILLWTALRGGDCYRMCLTDNYLNNLPTGDTVDKLLQEWYTEVSEGKTDESGGYTLLAILGEYKVQVQYGNKTLHTTFSVPRGTETQHFNIQL